ncbi:MAG: glycosyltransferase [Bacilli bacterium]|nr:glycosyltransferase [Bacilli bacterium]
MKTYIYFNPGAKNDCFEGTRLRKNIKGAMESTTNMVWIDSPYADYEILHLISPDDEVKGHEAKEDGKKLVVSALYTEGDPNARFFERNQTTGLYVLKPKAERLLEEADLVFVPDEACKKILTSANIKNPHIKILSPGVNLARFEKNDPLEKVTFYRYMRTPQNEFFVFSVLNYEDGEAITKINEIAEKLPKIRFFVVGLDHKGVPSNFLLRRLNKKSPKNITYSPILEDDVYRSAMINASIFLHFSSPFGQPISSLEAMAAKCQIYVYGSNYDGGTLEKDKNCRLFKDEAELIAEIEKFSPSNKSGTIMSAYKMAKANSLASVGEQLKGYYETLLTSEDD